MPRGSSTVFLLLVISASDLRVASYDISLVVRGGVDCRRRRQSVYDKKPQHYAKHNRTAHLTACSDKSVAYIIELCSVVFGVTLRLFVINTSSTLSANNKRRLLPAISVTNLPRSGAAVCITLFWKSNLKNKTGFRERHTQLQTILYLAPTVTIRFHASYYIVVG